jgi:hypothetical protein
MSLTSRYSIIWHKLKQDKIVKLSAPAEVHPRLRKAVIKRKDIDLGYKLMAQEQHLRPYLKFKSEGSLLTITLHLPTHSGWL